MLHEHILLAVLLAVTSVLLLPKQPLYYYAASGIVVGILFMVLFFKTSQPIPETQAPARSCPETEGASGLSDFFRKARNFVINNSIMTYIQGEDKTPRVLELLSNYVIIGAAYNDSARGYRPRCHPGTRVKILERLIAWFYDNNRTNSLLWLSGPAGVGKSAIMQTFAESVKHFIATVFISQPNQRNDPNLIFTTIAYQLAIHIDAYRNYVVERLAADPSLVKKSLQVQFQAFITEPFAVKKIRGGGPPVAILLDGLNEIEGADTQCDIIRLISMFTQEYPDTPLVWIIASRPERHISDTFSEITVQGRLESEFVSTDSTDACRDVKHFLRASFNDIQQEYQYFCPRHWPEETALAKLADAASGLFIFAETAVRFIRDPDSVSPVPRLDLVLSVIDRSKVVPIEEWPFVLLDDLYTEVLSRIPSELWPTMKLLIRLALFFCNADRPDGFHFGRQTRTLRGMMTVLQLDHRTVYAAFNKCFALLGIPPWDLAHTEPLTFLHASFAEYLTDSERSGKFYIAMDGIEDDVLLLYVSLWLCFGGNSTSDPHLAAEGDNGTQGMRPVYIHAFNRGVLEDVTGTLLSRVVEMHMLPQPESPVLQQRRRTCLDSLRKVSMVRLCDWAWRYPRGLWRRTMPRDPRQGMPDTLFDAVQARPDLFLFVKGAFDTWQKFPRELGESGFLRQVAFKDTNLSYRNEETCKAEGWLLVETLPPSPTLYAPESTEAFLSSSPDLPVLVCGVMPEGRVALFKANAEGRKYYIVPYCE